MLIPDKLATAIQLMSSAVALNTWFCHGRKQLAKTGFDALHGELLWLAKHTEKYGRGQICKWIAAIASPFNCVICCTFKGQRELLHVKTFHNLSATASYFMSWHWILLERRNLAFLWIITCSRQQGWLLILLTWICHYLTSPHPSRTIIHDCLSQLPRHEHETLSVH